MSAIIIGCLVCFIALVDKLQIVLGYFIKQVLVAVLDVWVDSIHLNLVTYALFDDLDGVLVVFDLSLGLELLLLLQHLLLACVHNLLTE